MVAEVTDRHALAAVFNRVMNRDVALAGRVELGQNSVEADEVHVWALDLAWMIREIDGLRLLLDKEELERAGRFRQAELRDQFIAARASRRLVLASYLSCDPRAVVFNVENGSKPVIEGKDRSWLRFNASRSHGLCLVAVAAGRDIGVDTEHVRPVADAHRLIWRYGTRREFESYQGLNKVDRNLAFLRWWTGKEAFLKAQGSGLARGLDSFSVCFSPDGEMALTEVDGDESEASGWSLVGFTPADDYVATISVPQGLTKTRVYRVELR